MQYRRLGHSGLKVSELSYGSWVTYGSQVDTKAAVECMAAAWDAGDLGCGELLLALRTRVRELAPGAVLKLSTTDPGAREDLPAWCRMTGHRLVHAAHPDYYVRKGP